MSASKSDIDYQAVGAVFVVNIVAVDVDDNCVVVVLVVEGISKAAEMLRLNPCVMIFNNVDTKL